MPKWQQERTSGAGLGVPGLQQVPPGWVPAPCLHRAVGTPLMVGDKRGPAGPRRSSGCAVETWSWLLPRSAPRSSAQHPGAGFARLRELRFFVPVSASGCVISVCLREVFQGLRLKQSALFACAEKCLQPSPCDAWVAQGSGKRVWLPQSPASDAVLSPAQAAGSLPCPQGCPAGWARQAESGGHGGPWAAPTEGLCTLGLSVPAEGR